MTPDSRQKLKDLLAKDPRFAQFSASELDNDITYFVYKLTEALGFFVKLSEERKIAIVYLCFVLGIHNFLQLKDVLLHLAKGEFQAAAKTLLELDLLSQAKFYLEKLGAILHSGRIE